MLEQAISPHDRSSDCQNTFGKKHVGPKNQRSSVVSSLGEAVKMTEQRLRAENQWFQPTSHILDGADSPLSVGESVSEFVQNGRTHSQASHIFSPLSEESEVKKTDRPDNSVGARSCLTWDA
jgi:hypothetical protein